MTHANFADAFAEIFGSAAPSVPSERDILAAIDEAEAELADEADRDDNR